jgi:hypothetical protein
VRSQSEESNDPTEAAVALAHVDARSRKHPQTTGGISIRFIDFVDSELAADGQHTAFCFLASTQASGRHGFHSALIATRTYVLVQVSQYAQPAGCIFKVQ